MLSARAIVDYKDWAWPAGSKMAGHFITVLASRNAEAGLLIAANGITGGPELKGLTGTAGLTELLNSRYLRAITSDRLSTSHPTPRQIRKMTC
jgi:hypothetical protein